MSTRAIESAVHLNSSDDQSGADGECVQAPDGTTERDAPLWSAYAEGRDDERTSAWVGVGERMPLGEVLLCTTSRVCIIGDWYIDGWRTLRSAWEGRKLVHAYRLEDITHWMPLPEPPQEAAAPLSHVSEEDGTKEPSKSSSIQAESPSADRGTDDMDLPTGKTCGDCGNWSLCKSLIGSLKPTNTRCDWAPSRFWPSIEGGAKP